MNPSILVTPNAVKEGKLYSIIPTDGAGDLDVVRATTATRVNSEGFIETVPYNLISGSNAFNSWNKQNVGIASNVITAPNGTFTGSKLSANNTLDQHRIFTQVNFTGAGVLSVYAKAGEYSFLSLATSGGVQGQNISFDLINGTIIGTNLSFIPAIEDVGDGWYRCSISSSSIGSGVNLSYWIIVKESPTTASYTGDGISGIYIWGAQLVQGTLPKPYYPTTNRLDIARLDYSNGSCPSILVEPQRTNLLLRSEEFDNSTWSKTFTTVTANDALSPDGTTNADKLIVNNSASIGAYIQQLITKSSIAITYTVSCFAKANELNGIRLYIRDSISALNSAQVYYNISDGSLLIAPTSGGTFSNASSTITSAGNGFYRVNLTFTSSTDTQLQIRILPYDTVKTTGNGTDGIYIWGAQLEVGSYATSYIPTVASTVTRNADLISKTGISNLIGQTEGTLYWEGFLTRNASNERILAISNATFTNRAILNINNNRIEFINRANSLTGGTIGTNILSEIITGINKVAVRYKSGDTVLYVNGVLAGTSTVPFNYSGIIPNLFLVRSEINADNTNMAYVKSAILYKTTLTDEQLILLTGDSFDTYNEMAEALNYTIQ